MDYRALVQKLGDRTNQNSQTSELILEHRTGHPIEQASKWAVRIKTIRRAKQAIVNTYEFALPQDSKVKRFDAYDKEWLDFIVDSRKGKQPWSGYDIIEGGVADDRVIDAVEAYINGYADVEHTLRQLVYHKPNYQICILSQEIVDKYLQFKSYERI